MNANAHRTPAPFVPNRAWHDVPPTLDLSVVLDSPAFSANTSVSDPSSTASDVTSDPDSSIFASFTTHTQAPPANPIHMILPPAIFSTAAPAPASAPLQNPNPTILSLPAATYPNPSANPLPFSLPPRTMLTHPASAPTRVPSLQLGVSPAPQKPKRRRNRRNKSALGRRISPNSTLLCEVCNQYYSRKDNLRAHQRVHNGERPYKCKTCNQSFRWLGALRTHQASHCGSTGDNVNVDNGESEVERRCATAFPTQQEPPLVEEALAFPATQVKTAGADTVIEQGASNALVKCESVVDHVSVTEEVLQWEKYDEILGDTSLTELPLLPELSADWLPVSAA